MAATFMLCLCSCGNTNDSIVTTTVAETTSETITATALHTAHIRVDVSNAISYDAERFGELFPDGGSLLDVTSEIQDGDTVMSMLKRELEESNIILNVSQSYIKGIGGLTEGMCGATSGWLYLVNGEFPMEAADKLSVNDGDTLVFAYTVSDGDYNQWMS